MASHQAIVCGVMAVVLFYLGDVKGEDCEEIRTQLLHCVMDNSYVDFSRLDDMSYRQELCRGFQTLAGLHIVDLENGSSLYPPGQGVRPMLGCISYAHAACPNLDVFDGGHVERMVTQLTDMCAAYHQNAQEPQESESQCPQAEAAFYQELGKCHEYIEVNLNGKEFCRELTKTISCTEELMKACSSRSWMTADLLQNLELRINHFRDIKVDFLCEEK